MSEEADVVVIGSGFGGSVAALRFARAGEQVVVLERGNHVSRATFQADLDFFWKPHRNGYGMHDLTPRGKHIVPWVGAAVGGGSHCYAGTLKRRDRFDDFPAAIRDADMTPYYERAEQMMGATPYPAHPPYGEVRATRLMFETGRRLKESDPDLVESYGPVPLGISFAPEGQAPGAEFTNPHGARQRYYDPREQSLLGGDIDTKNSLDRNYLHLAQAAGARIEALCQADRLERTDDGRWRITFRRHRPATGWRAIRQRWLTWRPRARLGEPETITARRVVIAAGAVGSTELLMRNRDVHRTLPELSPALGTRYTSNGDYLSLIVPFRWAIPTWLGFVAFVACAFLAQWWLAAAGLALYYTGLIASGRPYDPDIGTTNSDNIRFRGPAGEPQYAYIESGRYPTPGRTLGAVAITALTGRFRPRAYRALIAISTVLRYLVPPFGALARSYPIPLLTMGRDRAYGTFRLDGEHLTLDYDLAANRNFYAYLDVISRKVARAARAYWFPNPLLRLLGRMEIPHNQGGVPMSDGPETGVVDHAGRVFGATDLVVLDGSILPESVGPNPALTILAVAERAMEVITAQIAGGGSIEAEAAATSPRARRSA